MTFECITISCLRERDSVPSKCRPTCCASAAAEARCKNCQKRHDLARRRRSAASACSAAADGHTLLVNCQLLGHISSKYCFCGIEQLMVVWIGKVVDTM